MGIVKSCIILIAFLYICVLGIFCIRLANELYHLQLRYSHESIMNPSIYQLVMDAKVEREHLLAITCVQLVGSVFGIFYMCI